MGVLPRSRRGIWLLAGTVWCVACAVLWWGLPVVPRAKWPAPEECWPIGFVNGQSALLTGSLITQNGKSFRRGPIRLWDFETGATQSWAQPTDEFSAAAISLDGRQLAIAPVGDAPAIRLIDLTEFTETGEIAHAKYGSLIDAIAYSPNGKCIAYVERGWAESRLRIWDLARHTQISDFRVSNDKPIDLFAPGPHAIAWSPDSHLLAVADPGSSSTPLAPKVRIWNNMGKRVSTIAGPASLTILEVQFSPDSRLLAATFKTNGSNFVQFRTACTSWDVATGAEVSTVSDDWIRLRAGLSVLCDRGFRGAPQRVRVTNLGDTSPIFEYPVQAQERPVGSILAEDGKTLTLISETANPVVSWLARRNRVIPFLPVSSDNIQIVDGPTRTEIACVPLPSRALNAPSTVRWSEISPNGRCYARCESEMLQIWNLPPGKSRGWLAGSTALLALPIALGAWRRSRKLRAA